MVVLIREGGLDVFVIPGGMDVFVQAVKTGAGLAGLVRRLPQVTYGTKATDTSLCDWERGQLKKGSGETSAQARTRGTLKYSHLKVAFPLYLPLSPLGPSPLSLARTYF